jgi:hypothetical protein
LVAIYLEDFQVAALQLADELRHGAYWVCVLLMCFFFFLDEIRYSDGTDSRELDVGETAAISAICN